MLMPTTEAMGWAAAALTAATFACTDMRRLRVLALAANLAFIVYASGAGLAPVLLLHPALAPLNLWRLVQLQRAAAAVRPTSHRNETAPRVESGLRARPCGRRAAALRTLRRPAPSALRPPPHGRGVPRADVVRH